MVDFTIKTGNVLPLLTATLKDDAGVAADLTNASVAFRMRNLTDDTVKVNSASAAVVGTPTAGNVAYTWQAGDTDTPGIYRGEWLVTFSGGRSASYPNDRDLLIAVMDAV